MNVKNELQNAMKKYYKNLEIVSKLTSFPYINENLN